MPRRDLSARLGSDARLALVSAPAGYGKTATLAAWATEHRDRLAWLSCDPADAEPTRFMSGLLSAIAATWPGVADDAFVLLERDGADSYDSAVAVANELATIDQAGVILVDDLHLASPSPALLTAFIDALPDRFRFVVGTRSDPPLSLARLRLRGDLLELRSDDLRFGAAEMAEFLELHDVQLSAGELHRLYDLTEGWPAGVQLAAIALQRVGRRDFLEAFATTDRGVGDFLVGEVLDSLPPELVDFLVETSVLDSFDAELCEAVTGNDDAGRILDSLLAANLFVVTLDERARWYRYHHLFGAFLRARLASQGGARLRTAHDRAARALDARGDVAGALQQAMAVSDIERAGLILRGAIARSMSLSEGADVAVGAVRLWLHHFGATFVESDPAWVVELLIGLISLAGPDDVPSWLERVQRAHPDADGDLTALIEGAWSEHHQHRGQPLEATRRLDLAMAAVGGRPPNRGLLVLLHTASARAHLQAGELDEASSVLEDALARAVGNAVVDEVRHPALAAFVAAATGELSRGETLASRAVLMADQHGLGIHEPGRVFAGLAMVELHLERNEDDAAVRILDEVKRASDASHRVTLQSLVTLEHAKVARALGDGTNAEALLAQTRLCFSTPDAALRNVLDEEAAAQALRFDPPRAAAVIAGLDQDRTSTQILRARLALLEHDDRAAADLLARLPPPTNRRALVELAVLRALSELERDPRLANHHLREALVAGQPQGLVRTIVAQGPDVHRLLKSYPPDSSQERYVDELLGAARRVAAPVRTTVPTSLVDRLSEREVTVLRYLCSRLTYQEIAVALYVSLNTLKSHVRSVYRKLGVASRTDAVDAGRRYGLI